MATVLAAVGSYTIARGHGRVDDGALRAERDAGASDAEIGEVVGHPAPNVLKRNTSTSPRSTTTGPW
ncbi:hypothetical protein [Streptomyces sp. NPDC018347]|uniref:hypothetical protein n=1 Tax=Streptomyces sp. NPDC018347 TaxID=3157193 RepID=UPI0033FBE3E7